MEIEAESKDICLEWVDKLKLEKEKIRTWSGKEFYAHYGQKFDYDSF